EVGLGDDEREEAGGAPGGPAERVGEREKIDEIVGIAHRARQRRTPRTLCGGAPYGSCVVAFLIHTASVLPPSVVLSERESGARPSMPSRGASAGERAAARTHRGSGHGAPPASLSIARASSRIGFPR